MFKERGLLQQTTHEVELQQSLQGSSLCCYTGFDPTADSLHIGHLIPLMGLAHLQRAGHQIVVLLGGGTALIGDPSGKIKMRKMLSQEELDSNILAIEKQVSKFLDLNNNAIIVNNADWLRSLNYLEFSRDIGRFFSVNRMLSFETYKVRLETGLTFLEFTYPLLQAYDFLELYRRYGCLLQLGGDDQWANILLGIDLIRRVENQSSFGLTYPLLTTSSGKKMGKTEKGAVWLDPQKTSPYEYYQYWINTEDGDVKKFLSIFTFLPMEEIHTLSDVEGAAINHAKQRLAYEATLLVHGEEEAQKARQATEALFGGSTNHLQNVPHSEISLEELTAGKGILSVFEETGLCQSRGEARRLLKQGGIYVNGVRWQDEKLPITPDHTENGGILLRAGKKKYHRLVLSPQNLPS